MNKGYLTQIIVVCTIWMTLIFGATIYLFATHWSCSVPTDTVQE